MEYPSLTKHFVKLLGTVRLNAQRSVYDLAYIRESCLLHVEGTVPRGWAQNDILYRFRCVIITATQIVSQTAQSMPVRLTGASFL